MTAWLKLVGATDLPMPDSWLTERSDLLTEVGFSKKAGVEIGDELVLYAIPQRKIIGLAEVETHPSRNDREARWPWRSGIRLKLAVVEYKRAPDLDQLMEPGGRDLRASVRRQSHIGLTWAEFARARAALEAAFDERRGDQRR